MASGRRPQHSYTEPEPERSLRPRQQHSYEESGLNQDHFGGPPKHSPQVSERSSMTFEENSDWSSQESFSQSTYSEQSTTSGQTYATEDPESSEGSDEEDGLLNQAVSKAFAEAEAEDNAGAPTQLLKPEQVAKPKEFGKSFQSESMYSEPKLKMLKDKEINSAKDS